MNFKTSLLILLSTLFISCGSSTEKNTSHDDISVSLGKGHTEIKSNYNYSSNDTQPVETSTSSDIIVGSSADVFNIDEFIYEDVSAAPDPISNMYIPFEEQLRSANFGFTINDKANIEEVIKAEFIISLTKSEEEIKRDLRELGITLSDNIEISKVVMVNIHAPEFEVTNVSPSRQPIRQNSDTRWKWTLKPKSEGIHQIELSVYALVTVEGNEEKTFIESYSEELSVEITHIQKAERWFDNNWEWTFSTLILPLGIWLYNRRKDTE